MVLCLVSLHCSLNFFSALIVVLLGVQTPTSAGDSFAGCGLQSSQKGNLSIPLIMQNLPRVVKKNDTPPVEHTHKLRYIHT